jgi:succinate dehydrogenase / fumarate reductase cytochrome b subunit
MQVKPHKRPVYLNLMQIRMPIPAIVSILHRASGLILFLLLPLLLWLLSSSLYSTNSFDALQETLASHLLLRFFIWVVLSSLIYHLIAGIRHLIMDMGIGESLKAARFSAVVVMVISAVCVLFLGIWLW